MPPDQVCKAVVQSIVARSADLEEALEGACGLKALVAVMRENRFQVPAALFVREQDTARSISIIYHIGFEHTGLSASNWFCKLRHPDVDARRSCRFSIVPR